MHRLMFYILLLKQFPKIAFAEPIPIILSNNEKGFPPFAICVGGTFTAGIIVDFLKQIEKESTLQFKFIHLPEKRARSGIEKNQIDATLSAKEWINPGKDYVFSAPIMQIEDILFTHSSQTTVFKSPEDLTGHLIGIVRGYDYGNEIRPLIAKKKFTMLEGNDEEHLMKILESNRLDGAIITKQVGNWIIKKNKWDHKFKTYKIQKEVFNLSILFNKRHLAEVKLFDQKLMELKAKGNLKKILAKYRTSIEY